MTVQHASSPKPAQQPCFDRPHQATVRSRIGHAAAAALLPLLIAGCIGGGSSGNPLIDAGIGASNLNTNCAGFCVDAQPNAFLTEADVQTIIAQAVGEAQARGLSATIAVTDRVGNVLGVFAMNNADSNATVTSLMPEVRSADRGALTNPTGLEGLAIIPSTLAAIAKAVTASYLSSEGNAFTTRTASQIVQENFNPGELGQPGGPLFGVQFSQLPCSDLSQRFNSADLTDMEGPQRSPLGLAADPGGLPLYKFGTPVGGIGVMSDGVYGLDLTTTDTDTDTDELIAIAGTFGFGAPLDRRGERITVEGKTLRFTDSDYDDLMSSPSAATAFADIDEGVLGSLVPVKHYSDGTLRVGTRFTDQASGVQDADDINPGVFTGLDAFVLTENGAARFAPSNGTEANNALTDNEVTVLLQEAIKLANAMRAQIRRPISSPMRATVVVVDTNGAILGLIRTRDAPMFGIDVALQKARTAAFFSNTNAAESLSAIGDTVDGNPLLADAQNGQSGPTYFISGETLDSVTTNPVGPVSIPEYLAAVRNTLQIPTALADGIAFADRSGGNLSRPFLPDGINSAGQFGPFSKTISQWSPFSTGLQLDLVYSRVVQHVLSSAGVTPDALGLDPALADPTANGAIIDVAKGSCTPVVLVASDGTRTPILGNDGSQTQLLPNGIQIFPGSVPIYRGDTLVGGIGVSGDGIEQDDMVSFLGAHNAGVALNGAIGNAPINIRADTITIPGADDQARLRYVQCPISPFIDSSAQNVCDGK